MTFIFLAELDAINIKRETFDKRLEDIEKYFTNGDWTMAEHWVERVRDQYEDVVRKELDSRKEKHNA